MSCDLPSIDFPAAESLTVRLELVSPATMILSVYWGGDPTHTLGTHGMFAYRQPGLWTRGGSPVSPDSVVMGITRELVWQDLPEETLAELAEGKVLESVVRDAGNHCLVLAVMAS